MALESSPDLLENLTFFKSRCTNCGQEHRMTAQEEQPFAWCECGCGHVYRVVNRIVWH